jgi:hypothetical protein
MTAMLVLVGASAPRHGAFGEEGQGGLPRPRLRGAPRLKEGDMAHGQAFTRPRATGTTTHRFTW